jgi:DNA-binding CsgD family transcriptional regulator
MAARQRLLDDARDALASSLHLPTVVQTAYPLLARLVRADYVALGVSVPGAPAELEWFLSDMPPAFFSAYAELAPHDFVLRAVQASPNRVLRDCDMLPRRELERNVMYGRSRDLGTPLEHVLSALLHGSGDWQSGISLFRSEARPFSEAERDTLQALLPALTNAVRNCRAFAAVTARADSLEWILTRQGSAALLLAPPAREIGRTSAAAVLLEKWFRPHELAAGVPAEVLDLTRSLGEQVLKRRAEGELWGSAFRLPSSTGRRWAVLLGERQTQRELPEPWAQRLTARELEVAAQVVEGYDNQSIAELLGVRTSTLKKHLGNVFDKLGVDSRAQLIALARRAGPPSSRPSSTLNPGTTTSTD